MAVYRYGRPITVATQGVLSSTPLTIGTQGILEPVFEPVSDTDIILGGSADVSFTFSYATDGIIIIDGRAPIVVIDDGILTVDYPASSTQTINVSGSAPVVSVLDGIFSAHYPANGGLVLNGDADTDFEPVAIFEYDADGGVIVNGAADTEFSGVGIFEYDADGGVIVNGAADTEFSGINVFEYDADGGVIVNGAADTRFRKLVERGGRGTGYRRGQPTYYYYTPSARRDNAIKVSGECSAVFVPSRYSFIKTLPPVKKPLPQEEGAFAKFLRAAEEQKKTAKTYVYRSEGQPVSLSGQATSSYFDFGEYIRANDDELILFDILEGSSDPVLITSRMNKHLKNIGRDDEELFEVLDII